MKDTDRIIDMDNRQQNRIRRTLILILCAAFLAGITVASFVSPLIDTWCDDVGNQIILACSAFLILLSFGIWWMVKKCFE